MCLILFAHESHPRYRLVLAANRDESYARPTAPAAPWPDAPHLVAGRDLQGGGTWLGVTRSGRWAALTNVRDPRPVRPDAPSRGHLVTGFLLGSQPPAEYAAALRPRDAEYNGYNLLVADGASLVWHSNRRGEAPEATERPQSAGGAEEEVAPGVHGLSNHLLDTPWPKVERGARELERMLADGREPDPDALFRLLADRDPAPDTLLPDTGVGPEWERVLSSPFIVSPRYGTRSSTVLLLARGGEARLIERTFERGSPEGSEVRYEWSIED